MNINIS